MQMTMVDGHAVLASMVRLVLLLLLVGAAFAWLAGALQARGRTMAPWLLWLVAVPLFGVLAAWRIDAAQQAAGFGARVGALLLLLVLGSSYVAACVLGGSLWLSRRARAAAAPSTRRLLLLGGLGGLLGLLGALMPVLLLDLAALF